jgi:hypothetical protein
MGFSDCENVEETQLIELTEADWSGGESVEKKVAFVKFQRVNSITLFVEDNYGGDISALGGLRIDGVPVMG